MAKKRDDIKIVEGKAAEILQNELRISKIKNRFLCVVITVLISLFSALVVFAYQVISFIIINSEYITCIKSFITKMCNIPH
jgi:hypothetical protein